MINERIKEIVLAPPNQKIPATYMRGGTSKGVFFKLDDLPQAAQQAGKGGK